MTCHNIKVLQMKFTPHILLTSSERRLRNGACGQWH